MEDADKNNGLDEQIAGIMHRIWSAGLTTASGGNISVRDPDGNIRVTPAGTDKASITSSDIVRINPKGRLLQSSSRKPTSELPFHRAIYRKRKDIHAVIHAHPPALTAFSMVKTVPETGIIPEIRKICGVAGFASYQISGSEELAESVSEEFRKGHHCIIMENHATVVGGSTLLEAFQRFEAFELAAGIIINANSLGRYRQLTDHQLKLHADSKTIDSFIEKTAPADEEKKIREAICRYIRRGYDQKLMTSSFGVISVRWQHNSLLISPSHIDRSGIKPEDIKKVENGMKGSGNKPDPSLLLHLFIYNKHPHIRSVVISKPLYTMAFCVAGKSIDTRTTPEGFVLAGKIPSIPYSTGMEKIDRITDLLSREIHCVMVENDGIVVTGENLLQTYERLEVVESTAESLIQSVSIGTALPIDLSDLADLKSKFLSD